MKAAAPPIAVPPPIRRESQWRKYVLLAIGGFATAAGGAAWSQTSLWVGGIATRGYVDQVVSERVAEAREKTASELKKAIETSADEILKEVQFGNKLQSERVGAEIRERVGLQAALHAGLDPRRKEAAQRAAIRVRAKYDELVLRHRLTPEQAAERALELAGVPR